MTSRRNADDATLPVDTDERYFLNPESVSRHLYCSICQEVFVEPQRAPCGHSFCKRCILQWLKQSKTCPEDRQPVQTRQLHRDFILENIIGDQMVACPFRKAGCGFIGPLERLKSHKNGCSFNPTNLPVFLRKESVNSSIGSMSELDDSCNDEDGIPTPGKPSLKMRLFQAGENRRNLLCSMFDENKENKDKRKSPAPR